MLRLPTSEDSTSTISSPGSAAGATPCVSPDGPTTGQSGQAHVRVSRFRALDAERAMPTNDMSGPNFTASLPSTALQSSLESKLRAATDLNGSLEFALIWKPQAMLSGPPICALRASERRTNAHGYISWPTPTLSMSQPGADVSITGQRPDGTHATVSTQFVARRISGLTSRPKRGGDLSPEHTCWLMGFPPAGLKLQSLGNAIVPQVAAQFISAARKALGLSEATPRRERYQGLDALDRASQRPAHRPAKSENVHSSGLRQTLRRPSGNSAAAFLRRLRTGRPDLHARVLAGEISAYAGMIEAGWRARPPPTRRDHPPSPPQSTRQASEIIDA